MINLSYLFIEYNCLKNKKLFILNLQIPSAQLKLFPSSEKVKALEVVSFLPVNCEL